jgi:Lipoate-protein ligase A
MISMEATRAASKPLFLGFGTYDAATNMAIDEAMFRYAAENKRTFIRFYSFERPTIVLSSNDHPANVRMENIQGMDITRRTTGGKPIYVDDNTLTYSIAGPLRIADVRTLVGGPEVHKYFGAVIAGAIAEVIGTEAEVELGKAYSIRVNGRPIAGHGQELKQFSSFLYHGVIAIKPWDAQRINSVLHLRQEDYEELKKLPSVAALSEPDGKNTDTYKSEIITRILSALSATKAGENSATWLEILRIAKPLTKHYRSNDWLYRTDITLKLDSRFCLLYEG